MKYEYGETIVECCGFSVTCMHSKLIEGRNNCMTDRECLDNARSQCDNDPGCFGVSWYAMNEYQKLRLCLSNEIVLSPDGWRTLIKSTPKEQGIQMKIPCYF